MMSKRMRKRMTGRGGKKKTTIARAAGQHHTRFGFYVAIVAFTDDEGH